MDLSTTDLLYAGMTAVSGVVVVFWKLHLSAVAKTDEKLKHCEESHSAVHTEMINVKAEMGYLRGRQEGIEGLAREVLEIVAKQAQACDKCPVKPTFSIQPAHD